MTVNAETDQPFTAHADGGPTNTVGIVGVTIIDAQTQAIVINRNADVVSETPVGSGSYTCSGLVAPSLPDVYQIQWDEGLAQPIFATEFMVVTQFVPPPVGPTGGAAPGPCELWTTPADVLAVYGDTVTDPPSEADLELFVLAASETLFAASARQFGGSCEQTVRPCRTSCGCWGDSWGILDSAWFWGYGSLGWGYGWGWWNQSGGQCGCGCEERITLNGYPVTEVTNVTIDDVVIDPALYELQEERYLQALFDVSTDPPTQLFWPTCQNLALPLGQPGTWSITYTFGESPPAGGVLAAQELAWQLWLAQHNPGECMLPTGVTKLVRQGVTIERLVPMFDPGQRTGLVLTDSFIATWNPTGMRRRPAVWSPDIHYPRRVDP